MATKKFMNDVNDAVSESLSGLCCAYPHLDYHASKRVVLKSDWHNGSDKVAIICGGGSGHEPFASGFVGAGMLTAAVAGSVFAAPPPNNILHALRCASHNNNAGVLVIIPNYTGDCLNFGIAIEEARQDGLTIADIIVGDDCSIPIEEQGRAGKRGLVGLLFVIKIAGSLAFRGKSLEDITRTAETVSQNIATYGVGLCPCSMPGQGPMFEMPRNQIEIGLGVHGEAGYKRIEWREASKIVEILLDRIIEELKLIKGTAVAVIINNFGGSSQLEQGIVVHEVVKQLKNLGISPLRVYSGSLMTSLDSAGMHISVLHLMDEKSSLFLDCLDDQTEAPCWPGRTYSLPLTERPQIQIDEKSGKRSAPKVGRKFDDDRLANLMRDCLKNACDAIIANEEKINDLDRGCGDGDCGSTHKNLAEGILSALDGLQFRYPASLLLELSWIAEDRMGGTSGAIYSLMFKAAVSEFVDCTNDEKCWNRTWLRVWKRALAGITKYSKATPGDRTMLDTLTPACEALEKNLSNPLNEIVNQIAKSAWSGCEATKSMTPMTGRASYVKQAEFLNNVDAGSFAVAICINAITETIAKFL
ncbi:triokinase/FMN cyclase-like isoform X2 [Venturia canescens]|uniref:triokinase/FMN cyclase-like isoform X2 n=1 Tax=Venturia canescens TaxID=32260 RepID=UPI001C9D51E6|nr:triokinase/FMN cyclase-like isoform X2 [Venturia canescens]